MIVPWDQRPSEPEAAADLERIAYAAALLEIKEYDIFALAYRWWHGRPAPQDDLEKHFKAYMYAQKVPAWARHYVRQLMESLPLDPEERRHFGLHRLASPPPQPSRAQRVLAVAGTLAVMLLALALIVFHTSYASTEQPRDALGGGERALSCEGGGPGLELMERLVYAVSEKDWPEC